MATRRGLLGGALAFACLPLPARSRSFEKLKAEGILRVAVYRDFEPWSWRDATGKLSGIDVDLAGAIALQLGLKLTVVDFLADEDVGDDLRNMVWRGSLVGGDVYDVMMHVPVDRAFAKENDRAVIGAPYYREGFLMACGLDTDCEVPPPQLKGRKLAAELDSIPDFYLSGSFGGVLRGDVSHLMSGAAAIDAVKQGKADAVLATRAQVEHAMTSGAERMKVRKGPLPALPSPGWDVGVAVKDDARDLADQLDQMMATFRKDGTVDAILRRYGVTPHGPLSV
ncbi:transporter substrate-binding domain-containing protein [Sphingomonas donggukensis]|uniref:Transporter substrate-binding domain-containing protein n=1 Tax=Sphingomonas donggukensis TaxID=2949093 RepID=A0ABY4TWV5_9SPHN|nr:transporter substrate-binding domain-containing protein [Sphingomonas donggukensis]URW76345.1 transporter substrate-binding domain-containing protein [Sphingomonas donggukensis]